MNYLVAVLSIGDRISHSSMIQIDAPSHCGYNVVAASINLIFSKEQFSGSYGLVTAARQGSCRPRFCARVNFARIPIERSTPFIHRSPTDTTWLILLLFQMWFTALFLLILIVISPFFL